ncbi:MAG: hypothetical protein AAF399_00105 [Bacteroidota bacterium]
MTFFGKAFPGTAVAMFLLGLIFISGCRRYEDGPTFSLTSREERVINQWTVESVFRNDIEETSDFLTYIMVFSSNGRLSWQTTLNGGDFVEIGAEWELTSLDRQIKLTFDDPDPISGETRLLYMDIRRLTNDEMWLSFLRDGDYYDLKLK